MKNDIKKAVYSTLLAIVILLLLGYSYDYYNSRTPVEYVISTIEKFNKSPQSVFVRAWRIIKNNYVDNTYNNQDWEKWKNRYESEIKTREDFKVATKSMLASLNDPYTRFLPREEFEEQNRNIDSKLQGIGVHITEKDGEIIIVSVIEGTPAQKYGIKSKDKILKVDGTSTKGLSLPDVAEMVRGESGSEVVLTVQRGKNVLTKSIIREEIKIKTVKFKMFDKNIAYIRILSFISTNTADEVRDALGKIGDSKGVIVDVRGNYGGLLSNAVYISNMFIKSGTIVSIVDRDGNKQDYDAKPGLFLVSKPVVILVDESSASASEIFSGAMKDHKKAFLVGEKTYGKGRVQMISRLPNGSGINFTVAKYLTPLGTDIDHKGIEPDYIVEVDGNGFSEEADGKTYSEKDDLQLNKAVEVLLEQI